MDRYDIILSHSALKGYEMNRNFTEKLKEWNNAQVRKPLIIRGMRQTGKTWCVRDFAQNFYKDAFLEIN